MKKKWVKVYNAWFDEKLSDETTLISKIGTDGFTLWFHLMARQDGRRDVPIQIRAIHRELGKIYSFKKNATIRKVLLRLKSKKLIECEDLYDKTRPTDLIYIKVNEFFKKPASKGFSPISVDLFFDYIEKWGHIAFTGYCYLYKNHNIEYGNQDCSNHGFANPNENTIARVLGYRSRQCIAEHLKRIPKKIITVEPQKPEYYINEFGEEDIRYYAHHYKVHPKYDSGNKYYIPFDEAS
ncbi:hypothetical protein [Wukongibacter sp. M2B1]|uniref:hypothetical protein n=1 Tax=Wukongibacter sp. M2B1 TaxID=3088895 RepID=UPI003D7BFB8E